MSLTSKWPWPWDDLQLDGHFSIINLGSNSQNDHFTKNGLDLDVVKMYHYAKTEFSMSMHSKFITQMDSYKKFVWLQNVSIKKER